MVDKITDPVKEEVVAGGRNALTGKMGAARPGDVDDALKQVLSGNSRLDQGVPIESERAVSGGGLVYEKRLVDAGEVVQVGQSIGRRLGLVYDTPDPVPPRLEEVRVEIAELDQAQQLVINKLLAHFVGACRDSESGYWDLDGVRVKLMDNWVLIVDSLNADQHATGPNRGGPMSLLSALIIMGVHREVLHEEGILNVRFSLKKMECLTLRDLEHLFGMEVAASLAGAILRAGGKIEAQEDDAVPSEDEKFEPEVNAGIGLAAIAEPLEDDFEWRGREPSLRRLYGDFEQLYRDAAYYQQRTKEKGDLLQSQMRNRIEKYLESILGISDVKLYSDGDDAVDAKPKFGSWNLSGAEVEVDLGKNKVVVRGIDQRQRTHEDVRICDALKKRGVEITSVSESGRFSCVFDLGEVERVLRRKRG